MKNGIYGAIIGDMIGSCYENNPCLKDKVFTFPLWRGSPIQFKRQSDRRGSVYTDDTVTGLAIADALTKIENYNDDETVKRQFALSMRSICTAYEWAGYGSRFWIWLTAQEGNLNREPYNSYGNGSAMRVFPIGVKFKTLAETRRIARLSAEISHNHPHGIDGADCVASLMYILRNGGNKEDVKAFVTENFPYYNLNRSLDEIRPSYSFEISCQGSVPESILCFLEGNSFEECVRLAVSLGGDSDTMGCITGAIASMVYPIPRSFILQAKARLPKELRNIINAFQGDI